MSTTLTPAGVEALEGIARHYRLTTDDSGLKEFAADVERLARQHRQLQGRLTRARGAFSDLRQIVETSLRDAVD